MESIFEMSSRPVKPVWEGVRARVVESDHITLSLVELDANVLVPEHQHLNEQVGMVVEGSLTFTIDGETRELGPGGSWTIRADVPHEALAGPEGAVVVETFSPIRADWHEIADGAPASPRWPGVPTDH